jgi:hypothetical protein
MTQLSLVRSALAATTLLSCGLAQAAIVCGDFFSQSARSGKLGILTFVPLSSSGASVDDRRADRDSLKGSLKPRLAQLAAEIKERSREADSTAMTLQPYVCESTTGITEPDDLGTLDKWHAIGAVWSDPAKPRVVNIFILVPKYALERNDSDPAQAAISVAYPLPDGKPLAQWQDVLNLEHQPLEGVFSFGLGMAYLETRRYVAAKYSLCKSRWLIKQYLKDPAAQQSSNGLKDIVVRLDKAIDASARGMESDRVAEPLEVHAMCAQDDPQP